MPLFPWQASLASAVFSFSSTSGMHERWTVDGQTLFPLKGANSPEQQQQKKWSCARWSLQKNRNFPSNREWHGRSPFASESTGSHLPKGMCAHVQTGRARFQAAIGKRVLWNCSMYYMFGVLAKGEEKKWEFDISLLSVGTHSLFPFPPFFEMVLGRGSTRLYAAPARMRTERELGGGI